jgi:hypothetical protein
MCSQTAHRLQHEPMTKLIIIHLGYKERVKYATECTGREIKWVLSPTHIGQSHKSIMFWMIFEPIISLVIDEIRAIGIAHPRQSPSLSSIDPIRVRLLEC